MTDRGPILLLFTLAAVAWGGGCTRLYTGGFSIMRPRTGPSVTRTVREPPADAFPQAVQGSGPQASSSPPTTQPSTAQASLLPEPTEAAASGSGAEPAQRGPTSWVTPTALATMRPLGLYGHLPQFQGAGLTAGDGPDNLRQVSFATEGADFDPRTDSTGEWIAFASTRHRHTSDLYLARIGSTAVTQITDDMANDVMPAFSPDGKQIAFASDRTGNWDLYLMDATGGHAVQLTNDPTHEIHPTFAPDGTQLAYCSFGAQSGQWELVIINLENPATKHYIGHGLFPNWSPTGNRLVFQRARQRGTRWFSIWTIDLENGQGVRPTEIAASANAAVITPDWSPDGQHVVFSTVMDPDTNESRSPVQADVWIATADGTERVNLTHSPFADLQPVWGTDGVIYFVSNRGKNAVENIWAVRPDQALALPRSVGARADGAHAHSGPESDLTDQQPSGAVPSDMAASEPSASLPPEPSSAPGQTEPEDPGPGGTSTAAVPEADSTR